MPNRYDKTSRRDRVVPELHRLGLSGALLVLFAGQLVVLLPDGARPVPLAAAALLCVSLVTITRWVTISTAVMAVSILTLGFVAPQLALVPVVPAVAAYSVTLALGRRQGVAVAATCAMALSFGSEATLTLLGVAAVLLRNVVLVMAAVAFGDANRSRRERLLEAELRAAESERTLQAEAERAVEEERLRIARELHDVTAHSLAVIAIQSELARSTLRSAPDAAEEAINAIGTVSRESLAELRVTLGQLREAGDAERTPTPSLRGLDELVKRLEFAGCRVTLDVVGSLEGLPPFVDASAYRILQEAVTNIIRHADRSDVSLKVTRTESALQFSVINDRAHGPAGRAGHGLIGMQERTAALGGRLTAGPEGMHQWRVEAWLPLQMTSEDRCDEY